MARYFTRPRGLKCLQYLRETSVISDLCYSDGPCAHAVVHYITVKFTKYLGLCIWKTLQEVPYFLACVLLVSSELLAGVVFEGAFY